MSRVASAASAADRFSNPLHILRKRLLSGSRDLMTIADRASGIKCLCNVGSYHMFGETWHAHAYDLPGLPIRPGDVVLDIGANQGFFTCYAASMGATVYAFEPVPESYHRLLQNVKANGFSDRVIALQCAISDSDRETFMQISDSFGGGQSSINPDFARRVGVPETNRITVSCQTLSQILARFEISSVRLCKIDAEGSELKVLSALRPSDLAKIQGFSMEYHPEGYDLRCLIEMVLSWRTYQVNARIGDILHLVSTQALQAWAGERVRTDTNKS